MKLKVKFRRNKYPDYPEMTSELDLSPERTALVVIDMQNDFLHPQGMFAAKGVDVSGAANLIPRVKEVVEACRKGSVRIVYTAHTFRPDFSDRGKMYYELLTTRQPGVKKPGTGLTKGSWNSAVIDELAPHAGDIVIDTKHNFDSFYQTDLEVVLRNLSVETLIFTAVTCSICVETAIRSAYMRDFRCLLVEDCTWEKLPDLEAATKKVVSMNFGYLVSSDDLLSSLSARD